MKSRIQELAESINMTYDEFIGEMRSAGVPSQLHLGYGEVHMKIFMSLMTMIYILVIFVRRRMF